MTNLMGSFVRWRISVSNSLAALADAKLSITATPSSPMTKPPFVAATPFAAGLSIAAHTLAPTCFSVKEGTGVLCACPTAGIESRAHDVTTAKRARMVVRMPHLDTGGGILVLISAANPVRLAMSLPQVYPADMPTPRVPAVQSHPEIIS